eukprot:508453-Rhodomonas_salina.1
MTLPATLRHTPDAPPVASRRRTRRQDARAAATHPRAWQQAAAAVPLHASPPNYDSASSSADSDLSSDADSSDSDAGLFSHYRPSPGSIELSIERGPRQTIPV